MVNLFLTIIRSLFALIDSIVVWAIKNLYVLLIEIANTNVFGDFIYQILGRIYVFLGVFMLFKLSMSMITYVINPDSFTDKSKGFGKLITNVVIALILIVTVPTLFKEAFRLQSLILNTNAIYQIVTGRKIASNGGDTKTQLEDNANKIGNQIATGVFQSFIYEYQNEDNVTKLVAKMPVTEEDVPGATNDSGVWRCNANSVNSSSCMVNIKTVTKDGGGANGFANEYKFLLSTICGGVVAYFFLVFCLDAATRAIKLGVLQIIAPIPILSLIDPKTGTEKLKKWGTECGKEFAGLFIRLAGVFFAVSIIQIVMGTYDGVTGAMTYYNADGTYGTTSANIFVQLFIIIGALLFAKELPKWIDGVLGTNLASSGGGFNLKKRLGGMPGLGLAKAAGAGALGFAGGMAANALATRGNWKGQGFKGALKNAGSILAGGMSGGARGLTSKEKGMFKSASAGIKGAVDKRNLRDQRQATGYNLGSRISAGINTFAGVDNLSGFESQIKQYGDIESAASSVLSRANSEMIKYENIAFKDNAGNNVTMRDFKMAKEYLASLRGMDTSHMTDSQLQAHVAQINDLQTSIAKTEKLAEQAYIDEVVSGNIKDVQTTSLISGLKNVISSSTDTIAHSQSVSNGASVKAVKDAMADAKSQVQNSSEYKTSVANKKQK